MQGSCLLRCIFIASVAGCLWLWCLAPAARMHGADLATLISVPDCRAEACSRPEQPGPTRRHAVHLERPVSQALCCCLQELLLRRIWGPAAPHRRTGLAAGPCRPAGHARPQAGLDKEGPYAGELEERNKESCCHCPALLLRRTTSCDLQQLAAWSVLQYFGTILVHIPVPACKVVSVRSAAATPAGAGRGVRAPQSDGLQCGGHPQGHRGALQGRGRHRPHQGGH